MARQKLHNEFVENEYQRWSGRLGQLTLTSVDLQSVFTRF